MLYYFEIINDGSFEGNVITPNLSSISLENGCGRRGGGGVFFFFFFLGGGGGRERSRGYSVIFIYIGLGPFFLRGGGFKILNFNIFWGGGGGSEK